LEFSASISVYKIAKSRSARTVKLTRYGMGGFELFKELARRTGPSHPRLLETLPDAFVSIRTRRNVEQALVRRCILHHGCGLAVDGQHDGAFALLQMLQETG